MVKQVSIGSVSIGSVRAEDLIPAFVDELRELADTDEARALVAGVDERMEAEDYYDSDDSQFDLEELEAMLGSYAPSYCYFGAHEGDGADFGFWVSWDSIRDAQHDGDILTVADLSEVPDDYRGEVFHVNDHGNGTLYVTDSGKLSEVWSVV